MEKQSTRPESESTGTLAMATPSTGAFGQVPESVWRISGKSIDEFIEEQAQQVTAGEISRLRPLSHPLLDKLQEIDASEYPGLRQAVEVMIRALESPALLEAKDPLPHWIAETGFAVGYLLKRFDFIPDHVPGMGLLDDSLIIQRVIHRNASQLHGILEGNVSWNDSFFRSIGVEPRAGLTETMTPEM